MMTSEWNAEVRAWVNAGPPLKVNDNGTGCEMPDECVEDDSTWEAAES